ncbi:hypothetical protein F5B21DRAFT_496691 [Xylaria acuta]|nr:hypothetical protein F5B21DRAFT_496691 [Xylaria acuta]
MRHTYIHTYLLTCLLTYLLTYLDNSRASEGTSSNLATLELRCKRWVGQAHGGTVCHPPATSLHCPLPYAVCRMHAPMIVPPSSRSAEAQAGRVTTTRHGRVLEGLDPWTTCRALLG